MLRGLRYRFAGDTPLSIQDSRPEEDQRPGGGDRLDAARGGPEASGLIAHIQSLMEHQKALLARELHDELGGLLVGAVMDLAWVEQHIAGGTPDVKQKLVRARQSLASAIDLKRKLIEELRPTLLDNVGLFAAMRWHAQAACKRAGAPCEIKVPDEEHTFLPNLPIILFRIVQEALAVIVAPKSIKSAAFNVKSDGRYLTIDIRNETDAEPSGGDADVHYLAAIEQRVAFLGGEFRHAHVSGSGAHITARFPLDKMLVSSTN